jgi:hypothetical protein
VLVFAGGAAANGALRGRSPVASVSDVALRSDAEQLTQIVAMQPRGQCASTKENCYSKGCCNVVGFRCFLTTPGVDRFGIPNAKCMDGCVKGKDGICIQSQEIMTKVLQEVVATPQGSFYCFSVYTKETGSTKPKYELELLRQQYQRRISIFACDQWGIFSDAAADLAPGIPFTEVQDVEGDFHFAKRKHAGTWINTGLFTQVWKAIQAEGKWASADWVLKLDADAVFVPARLKHKLKSQPVTAAGIYLENCKKVDYGYFGNLEVFSHQAFSTLLANFVGCKKDPEINWKVGVENGKYGPMGEDLFAQACMDKHGVRRVEAFDITTDGACPADRYPGHEKDREFKPNCAWTATPAMHPFKTVDDYFKCYDETVAAFGA